jgi:hypothetical protein
MARHDNDGWWDNCDWVIVGWYWIPAVWGWDWGWSWAVVCVPDDNWRGTTTGGGTATGTTMTGGDTTAGGS